MQSDWNKTSRLHDGTHEQIIVVNMHTHYSTTVRERASYLNISPGTKKENEGTCRFRYMCI